ncbi:MAG: peptidyl-prolyl cis-trans isomerase SurA [Marivirga sp.]|jgi:peptidyl-prolyl cis-trans isomerase SurA
MRILYFLLLLTIFVSCKTTSPKLSSENTTISKPLFSINNKPVYADEFIYAYNKSAKNTGEEDDIDEYLDLYINFKLKVADAKNDGLDTLSSYKDELSGYLQDIKKPYLTSEKINEALLEETYSRLQNEVKAAHILKRVSPDAAPEDTLKAYKTLQDVKAEYQKGGSFGQLAEKYSDDASAKQNQGDLGWFTAFQMVYPFENAAYNTAKGELSDIVKTRFGYHLIQVEDKRETSGKIKIAHIMLRYPANGSPTDSIDVQQKIYAIHNRLIEGESWFSLAVKYSEDLNSKDAGGSLPWFGIGGLPKSLEDAAFKLSQAGQISSPIRSPYGWHIVKLEEKRGMGSLENMRESLSRRIQRDQRSELRTSEVIAKLKKENKFTKNEIAYSELKIQESLTGVELPSNLTNQILFTINTQMFTVGEFIKQLKEQSIFNIAVQTYEKEMLLAYEDAHLGEKYPQYQLLASEYRDGLLLFEIMNQKVWNKISTDTVGMKNYYTANREKYLSPLQVEADIFFLSDTASMQILQEPLYDSLYQITKLLKYKDDAEVIDAEALIKPILNSSYTQITVPKNYSNDSLEVIRNRLRIINTNIKFLKPIYSDENKIYLQFFRRSDKYLSDYFTNITQLETGIYLANNLIEDLKDLEEGTSIVSKESGQIQLINVLKIIPRKHLSYNDAKSAVITDYQTHLEKNWIVQLKTENKVIVNQSVLNKIKNEFEK